MRVRVTSVPTDDARDGDRNGEYGGPPAETYALQLLPSRLVAPGNDATSGHGACAVLAPWKAALGAILEGGGCVDRGGGGEEGCRAAPPEGAEDGVVRPRRPAAPSWGKRHRIMICGGE